MMRVGLDSILSSDEDGKFDKIRRVIFRANNRLVRRNAGSSSDEVPVDAFGVYLCTIVAQESIFLCMDIILIGAADSIEPGIGPVRYKSEQEGISNDK